ncbi:TPA: cellulase family glycosylhydrolase [Raoultella planticola]
MKKISYFIFFAILVISRYATSSTIGVCVHPEKISGDASQILSVVKGFKFQSIRVDYRWSDTEYKKGEYKFQGVTEDLVQLALENNISPLIILGGSNHIYGKGRPLDASIQQAFSEYAGKIAGHYSQTKVIYEIWNEWSLKHNYDDPNLNFKDAQSASDYFNLVKVTSQKIRSSTRNAIIVAGGFNPTDVEDLKWGSMLISMGIMNYVDGISIHPYTSLLPNDSFNRIDYMERLFSSLNHDRKVPVYITEYGIPNRPGTKYTQEYNYILAKQFVRESSKRDYIKGVWWYELVDDGNQIDNAEQNYGILEQGLKHKEISKLFLK